jgi:hypothetical protein
MGFEFATCNKEMALRHLQKAYPKRRLTEELIKDILPWIMKDIVRIQDPDFHFPPHVVPGKNWKEDAEMRKKIGEDFKKFHETITKNKDLI